MKPQPINKGVAPMKMNLPVTDHEITFREDERIVSTTDLKGIITSINDVFLRVSGFSSEELIGKNHNLIRHPDMPAVAFQNLWATLKQGKPWIGLVKNRAKNGDYYWVHAYVSPIYENEQMVGYQSVRYQPTRQQIDRAEKLYARVRNHQGKLGLLGTILFKLSATTLYFAIGIVLFAALALVGSLTGVLTPLQAAGLFLTGVPLAAVMAYIEGRPIARLRDSAKRIADNDLIEFIYSGAGREAAAVEHALLMQQSKLNTAVGRLEGFAVQLNEASKRTSTAAQSSAAQVQSQEQEIEQVATAVNELTATIDEIAKNASNTAERTNQTRDEVSKGTGILHTTNEQVNQLSGHVQHSGEVIDQLSRDFKNVDAVLQLIESISEQTNLLALNAAIEAARAGEHGRGFAVVADEVRMLANKTKDSTAQIKDILGNLDKDMRAAVDDIRQSEAQMQQVLAHTEQLKAAFDAINQSATVVSDMNMQIASAAHEQSMVVEEVNRNISAISDFARMSAQGAEESSAAARELGQMAEELGVLVKQVSST